MAKSTALKTLLNISHKSLFLKFKALADEGVFPMSELEFQIDQETDEVYFTIPEVWAKAMFVLNNPKAAHHLSEVESKAQKMIEAQSGLLDVREKLVNTLFTRLEKAEDNLKTMTYVLENIQGTKDIDVANTLASQALEHLKM